MPRLDDPSGAYLQLGPFRSWWEDPSQPSATTTYAHIAASNGVEVCETTSGAFLTWELHKLAMWTRALAGGVPNLVRDWYTLDDDLSLNAEAIDEQVHLFVALGAGWSDLPDVDRHRHFHHIRLIPGAHALQRFAAELKAELSEFPIPVGDDPDLQVTLEDVNAYRTLLEMPFLRHIATSADGTPIAYWESGHGPAVVLVHGSGPNHTIWGHLLPALADHFSVYAVDRRGLILGDSGPYRPDHAIEREVEDVLAVVEAVGGTVNLIGADAGALVALEATLHLPNVHRLVLEDPVLGATAAQLANVDGILSWLRNGSDITAPQVVETRALARYRFEPARFQHLVTPTLVLDQETHRAPVDHPSAVWNTPPDLAGALAAALPTCRVVHIPRYGQPHRVGFQRYVDEVIAFLQAPMMQPL